MPQRSNAGPSATPVTRRRQRSARVTVAVGLLVLGAVIIAGAVATGSWLLVVVAAIVGLACGAAATKITHAELRQTRRDWARDRAEQAQAYREMTEQRTAEDAEFREHMQRKLAAEEQAVKDLEGALAAAHQRAADAVRMRGEEARRAAQAERRGTNLQAELEKAEMAAAAAEERVAELEAELDVLRAELDADRASWAQRQTA